MDLTPMVTIEVLTPEAQAYQTAMLQKPEALIPEIWQVELQVVIEVILIAIETEVISADQVSQLTAEMRRQGNRLAEDNQALHQQQQIEIAPEEMLLLLRPEEELAEPMLQTMATVVALNTAIRNIKTASKIRRRLVILVLPVEIPEVLLKPGLQLTDLTIKDLPVRRAEPNHEEQPPLRAVSITNLLKPILVRPLIPEAQAPLTATLRQQDLIHPDLIQLQAAAIATHQAEATAALEAV